MNAKAAVYYVKVEIDGEVRYEVATDAYPRAGFERMKKGMAELRESRDKWRRRALRLADRFEVAEGV